MNNLRHDLSDLFEQLGLDADETSIQRFLRKHSLANYEELPNADFWNDSQRDFLVEAKLQDADWVGLVDLLDSELRKH